MRNLLIAAVVVGVLAAPSLGVINVKLTADNTDLADSLSKTTTVRIWAQGTAAGVYSLAGDIVAVGNGIPTNNLLIASPGSLAFTPDFTPLYMYTANLGSAGADGGWSNFGSLQKTWDSPNPALGKDNYVQVASYTVSANSPCDGFVTLTFVPKTVSGFKPLETDKTGVMGQSIPVTILAGVPEPLTIALLALGLATVRRRR